MSQFDRLYRRLLMAIGRGEISRVDNSKVAQVLQVTFGPNETRDNTARAAEYGFASNPPIGTDCIVGFVGGDRDNAVVFATNHKASRLKDLQPGEAAIHDDQGRWIWIKRDSIEIEAGGKRVDVKNATEVKVQATEKVVADTPLVECTQDLHVLGNITADGNINSGGNVAATGNVSDGVRSMAADRVKYNAHTHPGVTAGAASTGTTSQPE